MVWCFQTCLLCDSQRRHTCRQTHSTRTPAVPETLCTHRPCTRCSCASRFSRAHTVTRHSHIVGHTPVRHDVWADCGTWASCPHICCVCTSLCQSDQNPTVVMVNLHWRSTHQNPAVLASACSGLSRQACSTEDQEFQTGVVFNWRRQKSRSNRRERQAKKSSCGRRVAASVLRSIKKGRKQDKSAAKYSTRDNASICHS